MTTPQRCSNVIWYVILRIRQYVSYIISQGILTITWWFFTFCILFHCRCPRSPSQQQTWSSIVRTTGAVTLCSPASLPHPTRSKTRRPVCCFNCPVLSMTNTYELSRLFPDELTRFSTTTTTKLLNINTEWKIKLLATSTKNDPVMFLTFLQLTLNLTLPFNPALTWRHVCHKQLLHWEYWMSI